MADTRQQFIQQSVENGFDSAQIDEGLKAFSLKPLSRIESTYINDGLYGTSLKERVGINTNQFLQGMNTIGAGVLDYTKNKDTRDTVNKAIGDYAKKVITGEVNPTADFYNLMLTPYNTTVTDLAKHPVDEIQDVIIGATEHPLDAFIDLQPGIGALKKTRIGKTIEDRARNIVDKVPGGKFVNNVLAPSQHVNEVNEMLNLRHVDYIDKTRKAEKELRDYANKADLETLIRNSTTGQWVTGTEDVTKRFIKFNKMYSKQLEELGMNPAQPKYQTVDQFIFETINPNRDKQLVLQNISDARVSPTKENLAVLGVTKEELEGLIKQGNKLYDEGRIAPITQRGLNLDNNIGIDKPMQKGLTAERYIGNATIPDIARNYVRGMHQLDNEIRTARLAQDNLNAMAEAYGKKITPLEIANVSKNEVVVSPTEFANKVREAFKNNKGDRVGNILDSLSKGNRTPSIERYADDLFVIPKDDLKALANSATRAEGNALSPLLSTFKKAVLSKPEYFSMNRLGNYMLAATGGADYGGTLSRMLRGKYKELFPDYFQSASSYHGLNPDIGTESVVAGWKRTTREIKNHAEDAQKYFKSGDYLRGLRETGQVINKSANDYIINPFFKTEATFEVMDRSAVYLNEAKKYASANSMNVDDVLRKAKTDKALQRNLISKVNKVLGDYVGKNYYANQGAKQVLNALVPFNRIITTSADVLLNQARENPLRLQAVQRIPARVGYDIYSTQGEAGQPIDTDPRGGLIDVPSYSRNFSARAKYVNANPVNSPLEIVNDIVGPVRRNEDDDLFSRVARIGGENLSYISGISNALKGQDRWGNEPIGPNTYRINGKLVTLDENGNVLEQPRSNALGTTLNFATNQFSPIGVMLNKAILPSLGVYTGKGYYQPTGYSALGQIGDFSIPYIMEGRTDKAPEITFAQSLYRNLGERSREIYPEFKDVISTEDMKKIMRQRSKRMIQKEQRRGK